MLALPCIFSDSFTERHLAQPQGTSECSERGHDPKLNHLFLPFGNQLHSGAPKQFPQSQQIGLTSCVDGPNKYKLLVNTKMVSPNGLKSRNSGNEKDLSGLASWKKQKRSPAPSSSDTAATASTGISTSTTCKRWPGAVRDTKLAGSQLTSWVGWKKK